MKTPRRIFTLFMVCFIGLLVFVTVGYAATIYVVNYGDGTCSLANATSAYNAASAGDTIVFPAGNCTWLTPLTIRKPVSIIGAGSGAGGTKLTAGSTLPYGFFNITGFTSTALTRISGFYFEMKDWTPQMAIKVNDVTADNIRIDHNTFNQGNFPVVFMNPKGLIDNNYFYNGNVAIRYQLLGSDPRATASWESMAAGTGEALFIEDNYFILNADFPKTSSNERIYCDGGGKLVGRYNKFDSTAVISLIETFCIIQTHGNSPGGVDNGYWQQGTKARRGHPVLEFYNNTMVGIRIDLLAKLRGSANIIYNNTIIGKVKYTPKFKMYEEEFFSSIGWNPVRTKWPAEDQVHNSFFWNNTYDGTQMNTTDYFIVSPKNSECKGAGDPYECCTGSGTGTCDVIVKDRDYFLHAPCGASDVTDAYGNPCTHGKATFTGKNGASGSYPTDGSIYPKLGTMVFIPTGDNAYYGYKPYAYPHPLRTATPVSESAPAPTPSSALVPPPPPAPAPDVVEPPPVTKSWWRRLLKR